MWISHFYSIKFAIVIVSATLIGSCLSAPTSKDEPWWFKPCTTSLTPKDAPRVRHQRSTNDTSGLKEISNQFKIFTNKVISAKKAIDKLYTEKSGSAKTPNGKMKWLKIKKMIRTMEKAKSIGEMIASFSENLQHFAGTMDTLRRVEIKTSATGFNKRKRDEIYERITHEMRALLCEVDDTLQTKFKNTVVPKRIPLSKMNIPSSFYGSLNLTAGHLVDVNFFEKVIRLVKATNKVLKKKRRRKNVKNSATKHKKM